MHKVFDNILQTIGDTPLVKINKVLGKDFPCPVYAKIEYGNPGNSIKDRMAIKMLEVAEKEGKIKPGGTIIEGTSGNTGMGLAIAAIIKGYKCIFTTTDKQSKEKVDILKAMGAEVIVCPTNVEPENPRSYYSVSKRLATEIPNSWYVNQYDNLANRLAHYESTAPEIWYQTEGKVTHVVVASGTGGTITGIGRYMKEQNPNIKMWAIDSYGSLLKKWFETGEVDMNEVYPYISEGFGEDFVPENYDKSVIDHFEKVSDKDGAVMARRIAKEEGIFVGYSAGSVMAGLSQMRDKLTKDDFVVVIFHDHGSRYVGKIYNDEWMLERGFLEMNTVKDLLSALGKRRLISLQPEQSIQEAMELMKKYDIEQIPVLENFEVVGKISQSGIFKKIFEDTSINTKAVKDVMEAAMPIVALDTPIKKLSQYITKEQGAILCQDESGAYHILTQYDILNAYSK